MSSYRDALLAGAVGEEDDGEIDEESYAAYVGWLEVTVYADHCITCKDKLDSKRYEAGYRVCGPCSRRVRR